MKSVYIHIPFCKTICSYCDFCKMHYDPKWTNDYLDMLTKEIRNYYKGEVIDTIYIGGGTPSALSIDEIRRLMDIMHIFDMSIDAEVTFECNIENIDQEKLSMLYRNGVNRLSVGIQTFNNNLLKLLNRNHTKEDVVNKINIAKEIGFKNINIDLIYAIPNETILDLENDLKEYLKLDIPHISTYSLILEPNTKLYINNTKPIDEDIDYEMYKLIIKTLSDNGYKHYETSNFAKPGYESKHNLVYWNNKEYYGFGLGASGYINNVRYDNTRSINSYLKGKYRLEERGLTKLEKMENEMILGLRKIEGVSKKDFYNKYQEKIEDVFDIKELIASKKLIDNKKNVYISKDYLYLSNDILINFINLSKVS